MKSWYDLFDAEFLKINWEGIRQYMSLVGWCHRGEVPSVMELKSCVSSLFHSAMMDMAGKQYTRIKSGGFSICFFTWQNGERCLEIYFDMSKEKQKIADAVMGRLSK